MNKKMFAIPKNNNLSIEKSINKAIEEIRGELYDICSDVYKTNESMFSEIYEKVTESYNASTIKSIEDLKSEELSDFMFDVMEKHKEDIRISIKNAYSFIHEAPQRIIDRCLSLCIPKNRKEILKLQKACAVSHRRMVSQIEYFLRETVQNFSENMEDYIDSLFEYIDFLEEHNKEDNNELLINKESNDTGYEIKKIYCYEEMAKLAEDNNYKYKRSNGDHRIYEHSVTNKIIVIPAHTLGRGLSIKIQKQIFKNAC